MIMHCLNFKKLGATVISLVFCFAVALASAYADSGGYRVETSFGEEDLRGVKTQLLEIAFSEAVVRDQDFTMSDLEKGKEKYLKKSPPVLMDPGTGQPYLLQYVGREVKQDAASGKLINKVIFKYKNPKAATQWNLKDPILAQFDGQIFNLPSPSEGNKSKRAIETVHFS